jgi:hypothetical protein
MAHSGADRTLATTERYPVQVFGRGCHGNVGYLRECAPNAERRMWTGERNKQKIVPPATIVVVEQWICFTLGFACMAFGVWGIGMKPEQHALSTYVAWLGSLYVPTLRVTAVVCLGLGVMLVRRGWAHL